MKKLSAMMGKMLMAGLLSLSSVVCGWAANTKTTVSQVTETVTVDKDVDYIISGATPFGDAGIVNITNTEHAVLILNKVKPSAAIKLLAAHVQIDGAKAVNNTNCQVKLYNLGSIILPYGSSAKPLTVYSEQNFEGESSNNFGLGNTGGYMNTLSAAQLNNRIRSFKLKRGYMVTFSLQAGGRGYSRCFIAANSDLEVKTLPAVMDQKISSYRIFKWYDAGKKQLANDLNRTVLSALNVQSSYTWSAGEDMAPDYECIPNHIYEDWPSSSAIGSATWSPHTKTNNEPKNQSDDHPQDLTTILNNWENMMRTGMRLCSPASWDGSDYWNATGFLADFMDSIDARGWRCDIIDLHCYWPEGNFGNIANWVNKYKRPVWISEWCWGASWNKNGAFASGVTQAQVKSAIQTICSKLNSWDYVERYYYWNSEADISKLYKNGLTPAGEYYASMDSKVGYNGKYDFVPTTPKQYGPSAFKREIVNGKTRLSWHDANGEFNQLMEIQKKDETGLWTVLATIEQKETAADYKYDIESTDESIVYRLHLVDLNGKEYFTNDDVLVGDIMEVDGKNYYVGGNLFANGDFNMSFAGWTNGQGSALSEPKFQIVGAGGIDDGAYLQAHGTGDIKNEASVKKIVDIEAGKTYFFRMASLNGNTNMRLSLTTDGSTENQVVLSLKSSTAWGRQSATFNAGDYQKAMLSLRLLAAKAQIDRVELRQLFDTQEAAIADGVAQAKAEAEVAKAYNTQYAALNSDLDKTLAAITTTDQAALSAVEKAISNHLKAVRYMSVVDSIGRVLDGIAAVKCAYYDEMRTLLASLPTITTVDGVIEAVETAKSMLALYLDFNNAATQPKSPSFASESGWQTKVGSYTGGDQRTNTAGGKTCWNAWWNITKAANPDKTMEVRQTISNLKEGLYVLECKATTEHFCVSDQHGYIKYGDQTVVTPTLTYDYFDLPVGNIWETLTTAPIYVADKGEITIGFVSSKEGATDGKWHSFGNATAKGDNREGWWCATDFVLKYHPIFKKTVEPNQWGVICLPYNATANADVKFYEIVGVNAEYTQLCLEEIKYAEAGVPCIFRSAAADAVFFEYGEEVTSATNGAGNLRGFLLNSSRVPKGYYYVKDGAFVLQESDVSSERPTIGNYTGIMRPFADKNSVGIPVVENWTGLTMPISGVTDAEKTANEEKVATGIQRPQIIRMADGIYTIDGRSVKAKVLKPGLYIKVTEGRVQKTIVK